ncbi:hypothetical protein HanRHA438_Chr17g0840681 [Helianthus annuus]|nr:hypothetical protein HanHA89_Chr17g0729331 [Helianthus annuus]KAJ0634373.1 hypothetical protein HanLR1_Chr17g0687371 [Helianthus annuus]KAJ0828751.1 hypothetical protein HanRHA438_Chr17g0840681 [Helianthus annuus]
MGTGKLNVQVGNVHSKGLKSVKNEVSFLDVLTNKTHVEKEDDVLVLDPSVFSLASCFGRGAVGRTLGFQELRSLRASLMEAGFRGASIQYLGGLSVLIVFYSEELTSKLLNEKEIWGRWFSSFHPWLGQALPYERIAWVNILGVPPHLVSRSVFDLIGNKYGKWYNPLSFLNRMGISRLIGWGFFWTRVIGLTDLSIFVGKIRDIRCGWSKKTINGSLISLMTMCYRQLFHRNLVTSRTLRRTMAVAIRKMKSSWCLLMRKSISLWIFGMGLVTCMSPCRKRLRVAVMFPRQLEIRGMGYRNKLLYLIFPLISIVDVSREEWPKKKWILLILGSPL